MAPFLSDTWGNQILAAARLHGHHPKWARIACGIEKSPHSCDGPPARRLGTARVAWPCTHPPFHELSPLQEESPSSEE